MSVIVRSYNRDADYDRVGQLLTETYRPGPRHENWFLSRWEYMHFHPWLRTGEMHRIGIWEDNGSIVGVANYESEPGLTYIQVKPGYDHLKDEMLAYAERNLAGKDPQGRKSVAVLINDFDTELIAAAQARGFRRKTDYQECMSELPIPEPFPDIRLRDGFRMFSLEDRNDLYLTNRLIHRGFDHPGEPPENGPDKQRMMQSAPNFRKDLKIIVQADNGDYCAYAGLWYEPATRLAYVEPVCTDPDYRRLGLATAAIREGIRRCGKLGATVAYVGSEKPVYLAMGFRKMYDIFLWAKEIE